MMIPTAAKRLQRTERIIKRRLDMIRNVMGDGAYLEKLARMQHYFAKNKPMDCGRPKCPVCHYEKVYGIPKAKDGIYKPVATQHKTRR